MAERSGARRSPAPAPAETQPAAAVVGDGALDQADETVEATAEGPRCPHCGEQLVKHDDAGLKAGAWHCDACGGCWVHRGSRWFNRPGHSAPAGWTD